MICFQMYRLKKEIDLSFLTGRELVQVAIGSFQVQFHFDEDVAVSVEAEFRYSTDGRNGFGGRNRVRPKSQVGR
jgi:hypothetical protein